jgi:hypothetical protein
MANLITLENILTQWSSDCVINDTDLDGDSVKTAKMHAKYLEYLTIYRLQLKRQESKYDSLYKLKWQYYNDHLTKDQMDELGWPYDPFHGAKKPLKSDLKLFIETDDDIVKLKEKKEYTKTILETLEEIINTIRWRHSHIANMIKWKQFCAGA